MIPQMAICLLIFIIDFGSEGENKFHLLET